MFTEFLVFLIFILNVGLYIIFVRKQLTSFISKAVYIVSVTILTLKNIQIIFSDLEFTGLYVLNALIIAILVDGIVGAINNIINKSENNISE